MSSTSRRRAFTLVELLVVIAIIGVLVGLLLPAVQAAREAARRMSCSNNFKQIGLGLHNYHSAYKMLPKQMGGSYGYAGQPGNNSNNNELGFLVGLLPFIEQQALWEQISNPLVVAGQLPNPMPPMGPQTNHGGYTPWRTQVPGYRCPSDPLEYKPGFFAMTNYAACFGDTGFESAAGGIDYRGVVDGHGVWGERGCDRWARGVFFARHFTKFRDVLDGTANTIMGGEILPWALRAEINNTPLRVPGSNACMAPASISSNLDPLRPQFWAPALNQGSTPSIRTDSNGGNDGRGRRWHDGRPGYSGFMTVRPPNSYSVTREWEDNWGFYTAASRHNGGAHILMTDGAVAFITDSIEAGDQNTPNYGCALDGNDAARLAGKESPYGLWGALGTKNAKETDIAVP